MYLIRQGSRVCINTPAKLNLFLELHRRREDGFHDLETLMVPISLFDSLKIQRTAPQGSKSVHVDCKWADGLPQSQQTDLPSEQNNIVTKALQLLRNTAKVEAGATVAMTKRIPAQAGLGGGSSDAAAALIGANEIWQLDWPLEALAELGAEIGSDVPFFLFDSHRAQSPLVRCTGRGEVMETVPMTGHLHCVVVKPDFGLSTPEVFGQVVVPDKPMSSEPVRTCLAANDLNGLAKSMFNRLQREAEKLTPWIEEIASRMSRLSVWAHQLSGSGTSYFAVCRNKRQAWQVAARLRATRLGRVMVATTLGPRLAY